MGKGTGSRGNGGALVLGTLCLSAGHIGGWPIRTSNTSDIFDGCPGGSANSTLTHLLFESVNLSTPSLANVSALYHGNRITDACNELTRFYMTNQHASWLRNQSVPSPGVSLVGGATDAVMVNDTYDFYGEVGKVPRNADGGLDWYNSGPVKDDEFMFALNRHFAWPSFLSAWRKTGNPLYAQAFDKRVADWTTHILPAPTLESELLAEGGTLTPWRTIEAGIRSGGSWPTSFFGFQSSSAFRGSTRLAMVAGIAEHGRFLREHGDEGNSNWRSMQYNGLGLTGLVMPELNNAEDWILHAQSQILADMENGVYPDGVEDEETSMYHKVALTNFHEFLSAVMMSGRTPDPDMHQIVEKMYNYLAYSLDPVGLSPLNSDADTVNNTEFIIAASGEFNRPDWLYIASNGRSGTMPDDTLPSAIFPWAGQLVSRSGWDRLSQWSWFDVGPYGSSSHGHRDKLHISVRVGGVQLLVDSGRFSYDGNIANFRSNYGVLSTGHNVILVDSKGQVNTPPKATSALPNSTWSINATEDRARGTITFDGVEGSVNHTRSLLYVRGRYWIVVDKIVTDRERTIEALWHAHPNCSTSTESNSVPTSRIVSNNVGIDIVPSSSSDGVKWNNVTTIKGQKSPVLQGWYSPHYGSYMAASVMSYKANIPSGVNIMAWAMVPFSGTAPALSSVSTTLLTHDSDSAVIEIVTGNESSTYTVEL